MSATAVAVSKIQVDKRPYTAKNLIRRYNQGKLRFDSVIQRNEVWTEANKSLFIHSLLMKFPFMPVMAQDLDGETLSVLDGKQRLTTTINFMDDKFPLHKDIPFYLDMDIAGMKFSELPEDLQDVIKDTSFDFHILRNITDDERDEIFVRQNNGVSLTNMELTRAIASSEMTFMNEICDMPFFQTSVNLTAKMKHKFVHNEVVMATMMLMDNRETGLSGKELKAYAKNLRQNGYSEEKKEKIRSVVTYLGEAIPAQMKELRKVHIPMVTLMAFDAMDMGISSAKFGGWVQGFFSRLKEIGNSGIYGTYDFASRSSVAMAKSVNRRIESIGADFAEYINTSEDFKVANNVIDPEPVEDDENLVLA